MKTQIVLGTFFGDEGKGSTVQWLCKRAIDCGESPIVIRFSGGQQAGHRIVFDHMAHVCSSFGAGILLGVPTFLNENVTIDPICMREEYEHRGNENIIPKIYIHESCRVTTPYDVCANTSDKKVLGDGSCGMGIFHTFKRCKLQPATLKEVLYNPRWYLRRVRKYYGCQQDKTLEDRFVENCKWLSSFAKICDDPSYAVFDHYNPGCEPVYIFEGSQGLLLDMDCGFMPHCTPSRTGLNGIPEKYLKDAEVYLVMRTYLTRHGNGYEPCNSAVVEMYFNPLHEPTNPYDDYQGYFKYGVFDFSLLKRTCDRHRLDNYIAQYGVKLNVSLTHIDCLRHDMIPYIDTKGRIGMTSRNSFVEELYNIIPSLNKTYGSFSDTLSDTQFKLLKAKE